MMRIGFHVVKKKKKIGTKRTGKGGLASSGDLSRIARALEEIKEELVSARDAREREIAVSINRKK